MVPIIFHDIDITVSRVTVEHLLTHTQSYVLLRAAGGFLSVCLSGLLPSLQGITQHTWTLTTTFQHLLSEYISVSFSFSLTSLFIPSLCFFCSRPPSAISVWHVETHQPALNICHSASLHLFLSFIFSFSLLHILSFLVTFPYIYFLFCCFLDIFFLHLTILTFPFSFFFYFLLFTLL